MKFIIKVYYKSNKKFRIFNFLKNILYIKNYIKNLQNIDLKLLLI